MSATTMTLVLNLLLIALAPFLFTGAVIRVTAVCAGRKGASVLQPLRDFRKLMRKGMVLSETSSWIFLTAPPVALAASLAAACLVPMGTKGAIVSFEGDFLLFAYLLGLAKFFSILGAMDTGSSFEGMGATREVSFSTIVEPGFFMVMGTLCYASGARSFAEIIASLQTASAWGIPVALICASALFIMLLAEGCRVPVDDPKTHLELTMIHEVMVLDNSGPNLAFSLYGAFLRSFLLAALVAVIALPPQWPQWLFFAGFAALLLLQAILVGLVESVMARLRMTHVPQFVMIISSLAVLAFFVIVLGVKLS